jgi:hypothetical protein
MFFSLFGCIVLPLVTLILSFVMAKLSLYTSHMKKSLQEILHYVWIPPTGLFFLNLSILPLEMMSDSVGPLRALAATSIACGFLVTFFLQLYILYELQKSSDTFTDVSGASAPINI